MFFFQTLFSLFYRYCSYFPKISSNVMADTNCFHVIYQIPKSILSPFSMAQIFIHTINMLIEYNQRLDSNKTQYL